MMNSAFRSVQLFDAFYSLFVYDKNFPLFRFFLMFFCRLRKNKSIKEREFKKFYLIFYLVLRVFLYAKQLNTKIKIRFGKIMIYYDEYYHHKIQPKLARIEAKRQFYFNAALIFLFLLASVSIAVFVFVFNYHSEDLRLVRAILYLFILILSAFIFVYALSINRIRIAFKSDLVKPSMNFIGWEYIQTLYKFSDNLDYMRKSSEFYIEGLPKSFCLLLNSGLVEKPDRFGIEDYIYAEISNIPFTLCDIHLEKYIHYRQTKGSRTFFRGCVLQTQTEKSFSGITILAKNTKWFKPRQKQILGKNLERAGMSSVKFEETYDVYTTDQVEARYLLTPDWIERITALKHQMGGKSLLVLFYRQSVLIAFERAHFFEPYSYFIPLSSKKHLQKLTDEISMIQKILFTVNPHKQQTGIEHVFDKTIFSLISDQTGNKNRKIEKEKTDIIHKLLRFFERY